MSHVLHSAYQTCRITHVSADHYMMATDYIAVDTTTGKFTGDHYRYESSPYECTEQQSGR